MKTKMIGAAAMLAGLCLASGAAHAASFNCNRQLPPDMRMICNDPGLSARDDQAAYLYNQAARQMGPPGMAALQQQHLGFLRARGACRFDRRCMRAAYDDQIASLRAMMRRPGYRPNYGGGYGPPPPPAMTRPY